MCPKKELKAYIARLRELSTDPYFDANLQLATKDGMRSYFKLGRSLCQPDDVMRLRRLSTQCSGWFFNGEFIANS